RGLVVRTSSPMGEHDPRQRSCLHLAVRTSSATNWSFAWLAGRNRPGGRTHAQKRQMAGSTSIMLPLLQAEAVSPSTTLERVRNWAPYLPGTHPYRVGAMPPLVVSQGRHGLRVLPG